MVTTLRPYINNEALYYVGVKFGTYFSRVASRVVAISPEMRQIATDTITVHRLLSSH